MELCDGGCVATLLHRYGPFRWNIVARSAAPQTHAHPRGHTDTHTDTPTHTRAGFIE